MLERDEESEDTKAKIDQLQRKIERHDNAFPMKSFNTNDKLGNNNTGNKRKRPHRDGGDQGTGGGAGSVGGTDYAELEAHGYGVEPQDIVDESGFVIQAFSKVRQPFRTSRFLLMRPADI